jgi:hypothetical protein
MPKFLKLFLLFYALFETFYAQIKTEYFFDKNIELVTKLSSKLDFVYGLDNHSIDYYKHINNSLSLQYNKEKEYFYLFDNSSSLVVDQLNLEKIPNLNSIKKRLVVLETQEDFYFRTYNLSIFSLPYQYSQTEFCYGLVKSNKTTSILKVSIDTINRKINWQMIPMYDKSLPYYRKKRNADTLFSPSLLESSVLRAFQFKNKWYVNTSYDPVQINSKLVHEPRVFTVNKSNNIEKINSQIATSIFPFNKDTLLSADIYTGNLFSLDTNMNKQLISNLPELSGNLLSHEIIFDYFTKTPYLILKRMYGNDSIVNMVYAITKSKTSKLLSITSKQWLDVMSIYKNQVFLNLTHPIDRQKYIYKLKYKLDSKKIESIKLFFFEKNNIKGSYSKSDICGGGSIYEDKIISKSKLNNFDYYQLLDKNYLNKLKIKETVINKDIRSTIKDNINYLQSLVNQNKELEALSTLFIFNKNSNDTTLYTLIEREDTLQIKEGVKKISEIASTITDIPESALESKGDMRVGILTGKYILYFVRKKNQWYITSFYDKIVE